MSLHQGMIPSSWRETAFLLCIGVVFSLLAYGVLRYPASLGNGGMQSFVIAAAGLAVYSAMAVWARRPSMEFARAAVRVGTIVGYSVAMVSVLNHTVEVWTAVPPSIGALMGASMWGLMFLGFGSACSMVLSQQ